MKTDYVVGFLFRGNNVCLIEKLRPEFQKGRLNGPGGKVEPGETPSQAMVREFHEETGAEVTDWRPFCELHWRDSTVHFFASEADVTVATKTDEAVGWYAVNWVCGGNWVLPNLKWLIPAARDEHVVISGNYAQPR
jgi:8-oxo-dGTP diphosphatase